MNGENEWPKTALEEMQPFFIRKMPDRPKRKRVPEYDEPKSKYKLFRNGMIMTCKFSKQPGHNKANFP